MKKRIWVVLMLSLSLITSTVYALNTLLINYRQLVRAVETGTDVRAIIHLDRCLLTDRALQTELVQYLDGSSTRFNFTKYLHYNTRINGQLRNTVTTSMTTFVEQPAGELWTLHGRLNVFEDNTATLHFNYYDPAHQKQQYVLDWLCDISNGRDDKGLFLYNAP